MADAEVRPLLRCESCGRGAVVVLDDRSAWCRSCDAAAGSLGYNDPLGSDDAEVPSTGGAPS